MCSKINPNQKQHGGNLSVIAAKYPNAPRPFIDLSTGINPYPYPLSELTPEQIHRLADRADMTKAVQSAATHYRATDENITLASGMQPLMFALAALRLKDHGHAKVAIASPTYSEHASVWQALGHTIVDGNEGDVVIVCNPNNPDGRTIAPTTLLALAAQMKERGGWLIVDESFADVAPGLSITAELSRLDNIAVLRSFGKFYGLAGLRVSLAITPPLWSEFLRAATGPWPISTYACQQLPALFADTPWHQAMRTQLETESKTWRDLLAKYFTIVGHTPLFTLLESANAAGWADYLASQGILVRSFHDYPKWLRVGLPDQTFFTRIAQACAQF